MHENLEMNTIQFSKLIKEKRLLELLIYSALHSVRSQTQINKSLAGKVRIILQSIKHMEFYVSTGY